jgi:hypothetical protein
VQSGDSLEKVGGMLLAAGLIENLTSIRVGEYVIVKGTDIQGIISILTDPGKK